MKRNGLGIVLLILAGLVLFQDYLPAVKFPLWKLALVVGWSYLLKAMIKTASYKLCLGNLGLYCAKQSL